MYNNNRVKKVLIAEPERRFIEFFKNSIENLNFKLTFAFNGKQVVDLYRESPDYDLILMDTMMPFKDGYQAAKEILEYKPSAKIVALTTLRSETDVINILDIGCIDYLSKSENQSTMLHKLENWLTSVS